jgi:NADPH:quinone reductase
VKQGGEQKLLARRLLNFEDSGEQGHGSGPLFAISRHLEKRSRFMSAKTGNIHAVVMRRYGPPDVLEYTEVSLPAVGPDEVRIRSIASAVNHTDLEIRAGNWPVQKNKPFPYIPGVEVVGDVEEVGEAVQKVRPGDRMITMMQGLGGVRGTRAGGYAEYVTVAADVLAPVPSGVNPYDIAAVGLVGVTAYEGLRRIGPLAGRRIVVTGAAGGVGSAATVIARDQSASVIAVISRPEQADYVRALGADEVIITSKDDLTSSLKSESVDGVLDAVGGDLFGPCVAALRSGGTLSLVGAVGGSEVKFDAFELTRPVTLTGYSSENLDGEALRHAVAALGELLLRGRIRVLARRTMPLAEAAKAHALLEQGGVTGRMLLVP